MTRNLHSLIYLLVVLLASPRLWAVNCVRIMQDATLESILSSGDTSTPLKLAVTTGQIYANPGVDEATQMNKVVFERVSYKATPEVAKSIKLKGCFVQPICLIAKADSIAMKNLADASANVINFHRGDRFSTIATKVGEKNERVFLISAENDYYWVANKDVITYTNKTCEEIKDVKAPLLEGTANPRSGKYIFGFEAGQGSGYKSDAYSPFITDVPDPSDVGQLSNPVVTEVKKGKGFYIGPLLEINFSESFKTKLGVQYQDNSYEYVGKSNPTIASNSLDSLPDISGTVKNQAIVLSVTPAYEFDNLNHRLGLGLSLRTNYYISKPATITYRVGTVFKANELTIEAGPKGFETLFLANLYYQWYPGEGPFAMRLTVETDGGVTAAGLSFFY